MASATPASDVASAGPSLVDTGHRCDHNRYRHHNTVRVTGVRPVLTNLHAVSLPPHSSTAGAIVADPLTTLRARVRYDESVPLSKSLAARILAKASAKTHVTLAPRGSHTTSRAARMRQATPIHNRTRRNAVYAVYRGRTVVTGTFRSYACSEVHRDGASQPWHVMYAPGKYSSFGARHSGAPSCATEGRSPAARLALRTACR